MLFIPPVPRLLVVLLLDMGASPLIGFLELDGGARTLEFCGPTLATRLGQTCVSLTEALPWTAVRTLCASLSLQQSTLRQAAFLLDPDDLALATVHDRSLQVEAVLLKALCGAVGGLPVERIGHLDELVMLLARGMPSGSAAIYARALRRPGLVTLFERFAPVNEEWNSPVNGEWAPAIPTAESFFEDIFAGNLPSVIFALAAGLDISIDGPKIFDGDLGCCLWSPLSAAASASGRRRSGPIIAALLMVARADCNRPCTGPCGLTPLMHGARSGSAEVCTLLVRAGADVRPRHSGSRCTALEMGTKVTEQAIRSERDVRAATAAAAARASERKMGSKGCKSKAVRPNLKALANLFSPQELSKGKARQKVR